jgi:hypothetical protein
MPDAGAPDNEKVPDLPSGMTPEMCRSAIQEIVDWESSSRLAKDLAVTLFRVYREKAA